MVSLCQSFRCITTVSITFDIYRDHTGFVLKVQGVGYSHSIGDTCGVDYKSSKQNRYNYFLYIHILLKVVTVVYHASIKRKKTVSFCTIFKTRFILVSIKLNKSKTIYLNAGSKLKMRLYFTHLTLFQDKNHEKENIVKTLKYFVC